MRKETEQAVIGGMEKEMTKENLSTTELDKLPLTMSYTPMQEFDDRYSDEEARKRGTLYSSLDKPFYGRFLK